MAFLSLKRREDRRFFGGQLLALVLGIVAGAMLNIFFLVACSFLLVVVWLGTLFYTIVDEPGLPSMLLLCAIPILIVSTWLTVIVSVFGFLR